MSKEKTPRMMDLLVIDPRTDRTQHACYDSAIITGVSEILEPGSGRRLAQILIAGVSAINCDESYESCRGRWLSARGEDAVPLPELDDSRGRLVGKPS